MSPNREITEVIMTYRTRIDVRNEERRDEGGGEYAKLPEADGKGATFGGCERVYRWWWGLYYWGVVGFLGLLSLVGIVVVCAIWIVPLLLNKIFLPALNWERATFSIPILGLLLFASIAIFPVLFIPSSPSMWIAGIIFGYGYGFILILTATSFGMSLPFMIGSRFRHRIHLWLEKWPEKAEIVRLTGEGNCFHQFHAIALLRVSPFPYMVLNYTAVATNIKYFPYFIGSVVGVIPDIFLTMYSGILIWELTSASKSLSKEQIILDALGFLTALVATIAITIYAKRSLQHLQAEKELV